MCVSLAFYQIKSSLFLNVAPQVTGWSA